jgi:hypothetical protein
MCRLQEKNCNNTFVHSFPLVDLTFTYFVYRECKRPFKDRMPIRVGIPFSKNVPRMSRKEYVLYGAL